MWDPKAHERYVLKNRIDKKEIPYLHNYLCPNLTEEESAKILKIRKEQKDSLASLDDEEGEDNFDPFGGVE